MAREGRGKGRGRKAEPRGERSSGAERGGATPSCRARWVTSAGSAFSGYSLPSPRPFSGRTAHSSSTDIPHIHIFLPNVHNKYKTLSQQTVAFSAGGANPDFGLSL